MITLLRPALRFGVFTGTLATLGLLTSGAFAQGPFAVFGMAYATVDEKMLYIQGGVILPPNGSFEVTNQFYSLDLTQKLGHIQSAMESIDPAHQSCQCRQSLPTFDDSLAKSPNTHDVEYVSYEYGLQLQYCRRHLDTSIDPPKRAVCWEWSSCGHRSYNRVGLHSCRRLFY